MIFHKCCLVILIITLISLYIYSKKENFNSDNTSQSQEQLPTSVQLRNEISRLLDISKSRIHNLIYEGDINLNSLRIDFEILDNNFNENIQNEISKNEAEQKAFDLIRNDKFIVRINDKSVIIRPILQSNRDKEIQKYKYFDNDGLKEVVDYANNKYITVPNDKSLTNFYTLDIDKDYNIIPKIPKI
jgi:hypothetical protein